MNTESVRVYCKNTQSYVEVPAGISLGEMYQRLNIRLPHLCVGAQVNNRAEGLNYRIYKPKDVEFMDVGSSSGMRMYVRSLCFVLYIATDEVMPGCKLRIEHPISHGLFCQINDHTKLDAETVGRIKARMKELIKENIPFDKLETHTDEAVRLFREKGLNDKADLLETSGQLYTDYYKVRDHVDFYYGALLPSTGLLYLFDLIPYDDGMLLLAPSRQDTKRIDHPIEQPKLLDVFREATHYEYIAGLSTVGSMNKAIAAGEAGMLIKVSEALQEKRISAIADDIAKRGDVRIVLISGPSSSGKTTFSKRLSVQLMTNLIRPVAISLDNYFVNRVHTPRDEKGDYDYESLYALDLEQFNTDLERLIAGEEVAMPTYNFRTGEREYLGDKLQLTPGSLLILEGIHALNPDLTPGIAEELKYRIYVSALTTISLDDHNWIPTSDNRLIRRIVRDYRFRHYSAVDTIARWESVRAGEEKWIFPYQENADAMFNSAMLYELSVLKEYAEPILREVSASCAEYAEAYRLKRFLDYFKPIHESEIPPTSLLREFLGGSSFKY
jgi:uridine kinase